ncbi:cobalt transporter CbiM [Desulfurivibrio alkaliphilus]|uniref:Cobalamin (Vitamin B12) biosynthesis CbiM protein n=1 Tax=Desulfurivibrio alkaliphilus (strain DSM 19089 / UNIQEM U267 / AHT2) TaxID=589865 RepID=D6Z1K2_DESAT|nr:cobalt transporter CbiM [Desulfurivibrio alkaliphilus]ADH87336.1 cobalamin (vitamin B12) biosynthesis CbiM protein [Desulfurivibrio alkaliphilus AHT 2]
MHIADGILQLPVVAAGFAGAGAMTWYSLRQIKRQGDPRERIPRAALLTAAFFAASLIHLPLPPAGVHLVLNGLLGVMLGWFAFPAILVGLFLQAVMFGHGGLTSLGVNSLILGLPALLAWRLFHWRRDPEAGPTRTGWRGLLAGSGALAASLLLFMAALLLGLPAAYSQESALAALAVITAAHLPLIVLEGIIAGLLVAYLQRVKPAILNGI